MDEIKNSKILFDYKNNNYRPYIIYITILMIICIFIFLFFFKKETYIESTGTIKQNNILESFSSTSSNPVEAIYKKNDDSIEKNEKILKFDTSDLELQLSSKKENKNKLDKKNLYIEKYIDSLNQETNLIDNNDFGYLNNYLSLMASIDNVKLEIEELHKEKKNIQSEKDKATKELDSVNSKIEDLSTFKNLVEHETTGTFKTDEIRDKANEYLNFPDKNDDYNQMTISEITSLKNNYISTRDTLKDNIKQLDDNLETNERNEKTKLNSINNLSDSKISELEIETENVNTEIKTIELEINQLETDIKDGTITSKYSGIIEYDSQPKIGEVIATGTSIGKVINTSSKDTTIELYVPSSLISEVKKGQKVKFKTDSQNGKDATVIYSTVSNINIQPTTSQNTDDSQSYFIVHCKIDKSNTSYIHGLVGTGNIITGEVTYIKYLFNKFF